MVRPDLGGAGVDRGWRLGDGHGLGDLSHGESDIHARGVVDLQDNVAKVGLLEAGSSDLKSVVAYREKFKPVAAVLAGGYGAGQTGVDDCAR